MIDFERVWLPQIVSYARLINTGELEGQWLGRTAMITSVTDPDELHEQVFDDLDAKNVWTANRLNSQLSSAAVDAIDEFLSALLRIEGNNPTVVVGSAAWVNVKKAAHAAVVTVG